MIYAQIDFKWTNADALEMREGAEYRYDDGAP